MSQTHARFCDDAGTHEPRDEGVEPGRLLKTGVMSNWGTKGADLKTDTRVRLSQGLKSRDCVCVYTQK